MINDFWSFPRRRESPNPIDHSFIIISFFASPVIFDTEASDFFIHIFTFFLKAGKRFVLSPHDRAIMELKRHENDCKYDGANKTAN